MKKTLLIVGGGTESLPGIKAAKSMGLHVVASDMNPQALGMAAADDQLVASTYDVAATVAQARAFHLRVRPLDGVICIGTDVPHTVAGVAEDLALPGISMTVAQRAIDKLAMKDKFNADGISIPGFSSIESVGDLRLAMDEIGLPLVIKPVDSRGGRGVNMLTQAAGAQWAYRTAQQQSPSGRVMAERYLSGPQVSTESLVQEGQVFTLGFSDRNYEYLERFAPYFIENGGDLPSHLPEETQQAVHRLVAKAAASLGVDNGVVKGDVVVHDGRPYIIEMAARLSGGFFCTHEIPINTGVDFVGAAIKIALGVTVSAQSLIPQMNRSVVQRYIFPKPGRIVDISGVSQARSLAGIEAVVLLRAKGDLVEPPQNSNGSAAMVLASGDTHEHAKQSIVAAMNTLSIKTEPT